MLRRRLGPRKLATHLARSRSGENTQRELEPRNGNVGTSVGAGHCILPSFGETDADDSAPPLLLAKEFETSINFCRLDKVQRLSSGTAAARFSTCQNSSALLVDACTSAKPSSSWNCSSIFLNGLPRITRTVAQSMQSADHDGLVAANLFRKFWKESAVQTMHRSKKNGRRSRRTR